MVEAWPAEPKGHLAMVMLLLCGHCERISFRVLKSKGWETKEGWAIDNTSLSEYRASLIAADEDVPEWLTEAIDG